MAIVGPVDSKITADVLVVGGGISGMTTAIETAEIGKDVVLIEKLPSLGGQVAAMSTSGWLLMPLLMVGRLPVPYTNNSVVK